jgi:hypothetical protein
MADKAALLKRVQEDAEALGKLTSRAVNFPLEQYVDKAGLDALCDAFALEPDDWKANDLETILIIRDGLYELRNKLRDVGDDAEHSVEQIISATDRLYTDLERAFREFNPSDLVKAQQQIAALHRTMHVASATASNTVSNLKAEAVEVLTQTHATVTHLEFNLIKIDRSVANIELFKNAKLIVRRLSASVFAIKLSLEQSIIYEGVFKFLHEGADRIVSDLRDLVAKIQSSYQTALDFAGDLSKLAEKGSRFTRLVGEFLSNIFSEAERPEHRGVVFKVQNYGHSEVMLTGVMVGKNQVVLGGRRGIVWNVDVQSMRAVSQRRIGKDNINSLIAVDGQELAVGSDDGLDLISTTGQATLRQGSRHERITSVTSVPWGVREEGGLVTGSRDGIVRRWTFAGGLSEFAQETYAKVGRTVRKVVTQGEEVVVATADALTFVNEDMQEGTRIPLQFEINDVLVFDEQTLVVCGLGNIAYVNTAGGAFSRFVTTSTDVDYTCIAKLGPKIVAVGAADGKLSAFDLVSGQELGSVKVNFPVKGIVPVANRVVVYGGHWDKKGPSMASIIWNETVEKAISTGGEEVM